MYNLNNNNIFFNNNIIINKIFLFIILLSLHYTLSFLEHMDWYTS
jgi:hypothetical protein